MKKREKRGSKNTILIEVIISIIFILNLSYISSEENLGCCLEMENGAKCQSVPMDFVGCKSNIFPTECKEVSSCYLGCCIDEKEGTCSPQTTEEACEAAKGKWENSERCEILACQNGCCTLGSENIWTTERRCQKFSLEKGFPLRFSRGNISEGECLEKEKEQEFGACLVRNNRCIFGTWLECMGLEGEFKKDSLCSDPDLGNLCEKQQYVGCFDGKEELYWFDSCGNRENIYDADKEKSWNNGKVLSKEESCNSNSANINSENCGNCNYDLGSICSKSSNALGKKVKDGNFVCRDLNCYEQLSGELGVIKRENGESWCGYDGVVGLGRDLVGSRHWVMTCIDGEIKAEGCEDLRYEVCTEKKVYDIETKKFIS